MRYIPFTSEIEQQMQEEIGVNTFEDLLETIPSKLRIKKDLGLPAGISELELINEFNQITSNINFNNNLICFAGAGAYDHFVPSVVDFLAKQQISNGSPWDPGAS